MLAGVALGEGLPETFFDYGCVPQESRAEVYELTKSVKDARGRHLAVIVEIGGALRRAKELLGHGNFLPWLKAEFRWSERTARNYEPRRSLSGQRRRHNRKLIASVVVSNRRHRP